MSCFLRLFSISVFFFPLFYSGGLEAAAPNLSLETVELSKLGRFSIWLALAKLGKLFSASLLAYFASVFVLDATAFEGVGLSYL